MIRLLSSPADLATYDRWEKSHPQGSLWQSLEWKRYQEALGREVRMYACFEGEEIVASALVVIDRTVGGFSTWDIPRGPLGATSDELRAGTTQLLEFIEVEADQNRCLSLFLSPTVPLEAPLDCARDRLRSKLKASSRCEHPPATRIIDLTQTEEQILLQMHQKGRYNIRVAERHGVKIERGTARDIDSFYDLLRSTSKRDIFTISPKSHYARFLTHLEGSFFLMARHDEQPVAGLLGVTWNGTGFYYYGASNHAHRALMAPYLLQWEAMKLCKRQGCARYDLLGIAPPDAAPNHPWQGISAFKEKFGGTVLTYPPEQEIVLRPVLKRVLGWKRKIVG